MEGQVDGKDLSELPLANNLADPLHGCGMTIGQINPQQSVGRFGRGNNCSDFDGRSSKRLLAEDGDACVKRLDRLIGMLSARCGNDNAIELFREKCLEILEVFCGPADPADFFRH
jgi:hypothetical protein